ncbi:MAG: DUF3187 family protein [Spirochaetota bacterium]
MKGFRARKASLSFCVLAAILAPVASVSEEQDGFSTMPLFPLTQGLAPYANSSGSILKPGQLSLDSALVWTNTLRYDDGSEYPGYALIVDGESLVEHLNFRAGIGHGLELEAWLEGSQLFAGYFDTLIEGFHLAFGFPNQARADFPSNKLEILVDTPAGPALDVTSPRAGLTSWGLGISAVPLPGLPLSLGVKLKLPAPVVSPWFLTGATALSSALTWHQEWRFIESAFSVGAAWQADSGMSQFVPLRSILLQGGARLFFRTGESILLGVEAAGSQSPYLVDEMYLGGIVGNLWIGGKVRISEELSLSVALIEELASWASIEVGLSFGLTWKPQYARK